MGSEHVLTELHFSAFSVSALRIEKAGFGVTVYCAGLVNDNLMPVVLDEAYVGRVIISHFPHRTSWVDSGG